MNGGEIESSQIIMVRDPSFDPSVRHRLQSCLFRWLFNTDRIGGYQQVNYWFSYLSQDCENGLEWCFEGERYMSQHQRDID